jgi:hypothetical protein
MAATAAPVKALASVARASPRPTPPASVAVASSPSAAPRSVTRRPSCGYAICCDLTTSLAPAVGVVVVAVKAFR